MPGSDCSYVNDDDEIDGFDIGVTVEGEDVTLHITGSMGASDVTLKGINVSDDPSASNPFDGATTLDDLFVGGLQVDFNPEDFGD